MAGYIQVDTSDCSRYYSVRIGAGSFVCALTCLLYEYSLLYLKPGTGYIYVWQEIYIRYEVREYTFDCCSLLQDTTGRYLVILSAGGIHPRIDIPGSLEPLYGH